MEYFSCIPHSNALCLHQETEQRSMDKIITSLEGL